MTEPMLHTALALLLAHVLADFVFQTNVMVARKREPMILLLHIAIVGLLSLIALGGAWQVALGIAAAHLVIDAIKTYALPDSLASFLGDQLAHLFTIAAAAYLVPDAMQTSVWAPYLATLTAPAIIATGLIITSFAGGHVVGYLMRRFDGDSLKDGLPNAGRLIGQLERSLIYLMVLIGEPAGIGFLIAAKSVLRFDTASKDQKASEYVIIGTLASFGWALFVAYGVTAALAP